MKTLSYMSAIILGFSLCACDGASPPVAGSANPVAPAPSTTIALPLGPSGAVPSGPMPAVRPPNVFTDGQMLSVLAASNAKEVEVSKIVAGRTKDAGVKAFAEMMVQHHGDAQKKLDDLGDAPGKREPTPDATKIEEDTRAALDRFRSVPAAELDASYVDAMVHDHVAVLELVETRMIPVVAHAKLKALLTEDLQPTIAKHLERAKELASSRAAGAASSASASPSAAPLAPPPASGARPAPAPTGHPAAGASAPKP